MSRFACVAFASLLLAACAGHALKQPAPATATTHAPTHPARKPWKPLGPYTPGGLYAPGVSDGAPETPADVANLTEPVPRVEPLSRYGNRSPYVVLGKTYTVLSSAGGYVERGVASWYGTKFDGRATSNFEAYDMYQFTAAHRTLPLPSYARVTNLDNGRSVIVRINDRGPFHEGRLIDLSYAAAVRLGVNVHGTANVEVRGIDPGQPLPPASVVSPATADAARAQPKPKPKPDAIVPKFAPVAVATPASVPDAAAVASALPAVGMSATSSPKDDAAVAPQTPAATPVAPAPMASGSNAALAQPVIERPPIEPSTRGFLQVASYSDRANAERMLQRLQQAGVEHAELVPVQVNDQTLWRVHIGPLTADEAGRVAEHLDALGFGNPPFFKD